MRVGIDATCLNNRPSGARQRFVGMFSNLVRKLPRTEFVIFEPKDCRVAEWFDSAPNLSVRRTPLPSEDRMRRYLLGRLYWRSAFAAERFDVFESLHLPLVKAPAGRTILTIHDVRELNFGRRTAKGLFLKNLL